MLTEQEATILIGGQRNNDLISKCQLTTLTPTHY